MTTLPNQITETTTTQKQQQSSSKNTWALWVETKSVRKGGRGVGKDDWNESDCCIGERMVGDVGRAAADLQ